MTRLVTEWVKVAGDISIIARESGEVWFHCARWSDALPTEGAAWGVCLFLSRLDLGKITELERPRRHPKAFGT
jgi:hypothetical protein